MVARNRTKKVVILGGTATWWITTPVPLVQTPITLKIDSCADQTGRHSDHALTITHVDRTGLMPLSGIEQPPTGHPTRIYSDWWPTGFHSGSDTHVPTSAPSMASYGASVLSRTNPSRAQESVFNFVYELKDLPGMLRDIGRLHKFGRNARGVSKQAANVYLSGIYGWAPLISDLRKMMDFKRLTDIRVKELHKLYSKGGLKRRVNLGSYAAQASSNNVVIDSSMTEQIICNLSKQTTVTDWATVRWRPTTLPAYNPNDDSIRKYAFKLVYGLDAQLVYAWDALPWTWLIDWFTNIHDYLNSNSYVVPAIPSSMNIMRTMKTLHQYSRNDTHFWAHGGSGVGLYTTKFRIVNPPVFITASLPFLSRRQLSILGALAIQRIR